MTEIELKFQVPDAARPALHRAVDTDGAHHTRLQAVYFDTPDRRLAAAGIGLRLRLEGDRWVQTVKAGDPHAMVRHEHNVPVAGASEGPPPPLDLSRHDGTPAGTLLQRAAGGVALVALYRTDITRTHRVLEVTGGRVELALDIGEITAQGRRWPVHELEIELVDGDPACVLDTALAWVQQHGLWLDVRSKAERGDRLSRDDRHGTPVRAAHAAWPKRPDGTTLRQAMVAEGLRHLLPNASEAASGTGTPEHLHQVRVALRRLRNGLRLLDGIAPAPDTGWPVALADLYHRLAALRDRDAVSATWGPALKAAGAPEVELPACAAPETVEALMQDRSFTRLLLSMLALQLAPTGGEEAGSEAAGKRPEALHALKTRLDHWHHQVRRQARHPERLDDDTRHRLRRRIKRLDDATGFVAAHFPAKQVRRYLARLEDAQKALGRLTDLQAAIALHRRAAAERPEAWFAVGWLTAQRDPLLAESTAALARVARARPFWRR